MTATPEEGAAAALAARCEAIEEAYEFMLAYASQGLPDERGSDSGSQIRDCLRRFDAALTGLGALLSGFVAQLGVDSPEPYHAFIAVLERDAGDTQAALRLAMVQPAIGSQLVDNLNASIHVRALLTDLFLIDEILKALARLTTPES